MKLYLLTELKEKFNPVIFGCNFCITHFESLDELNIHVATVHSFKCDLCPSQFVELVLLTKHKEKYHPAIFGCNYCVYRFASLDELNKHVTSVHRFQCDMCPVWYTDIESLTLHKEQCHLAISYCNYCDHSFAQVKDMKLHLSCSHNFECVFCLSWFVDLAKLTEHKKQCRHPERFSCAICFAITPSLKESENHREKSHPAQHQCSLCFSKFASKNAMNQHISNFHEFKCEKCETWFYIPQPGPCMTFPNFVRKPISLGNALLLCNKETCSITC